MVKRQMNDSNLHRVSPNSAGDGFLKDTSEKSQQSESSSEEEESKINGMLRWLTRRHRRRYSNPQLSHRRYSNPQPRTFRPFARSGARYYSNRHRVSLNSAVVRFLKNISEKSQQSESSGEEEESEINRMPRWPTRRRRYLNPHPRTFSPFARSVARACSYMVKRQMKDSNLHRVSPNSAGDGFLKDTSEKSQQSESSSEEESEGDVQADFAFFDPKPNDFHGVKTLLQTYLDNKQWDLSAFVDLILEQTRVGTVVKIEGDEDDGVFSVVTALNLGRHKEHKCVKELIEFLLKACQEKDVVDDLGSLLGDQAQNVGLLVSQRVVNLPPQLLPPLYDALFDEVSWAMEDEPTEELRNSFCFKFYILLSKIYKHKNADQKKRLGNDSDEAIIYTKPEDEIFHRLSSWSFSFPLHNQQPTHELKNYRSMGLVMAVEADKISTFRQELKSLINE